MPAAIHGRISYFGVAASSRLMPRRNAARSHGTTMAVPTAGSNSAPAGPIPHRRP